MDSFIARLVRDFENGQINRRQLVQTLTMAFAAATAGTAAAAPQKAGAFKVVGLDHLSYQVTDYRKTRDFYADLFGMTVKNDNNSTQCELHFGEHGSMMVARNRRAGADPKPTVDHVAYKIDNWNTDKVKAELERRGLQPRLDTGAGPGVVGGPVIPGYASFMVSDPDGYVVQISGDVKPGDSLYKKG